MRCPNRNPMLFLVAAAAALTCGGVGVPEFDIHGSVKTIEASSDGWVYFGAGFGDFGHTVQVRAWDTIESEDISEFYYTLDNTCPTKDSLYSTSSKLFLEGGTSQFAIFAINTTASELVVSVASTVRPVHPNSVTLVIYCFFIFFGVNFVLTGTLQFHYFRNAMDPNEYRVPD